MPRFESHQLYIGGRLQDATSGKTFQTLNPANGEVLAEMRPASRMDVDAAVKSAKAGQQIWAAMSAMQSSHILRRAVEILRARNDEIAALETLDTGKPISETRTMAIATGAEVLNIMQGLCLHYKAAKLPYANLALCTRAASRLAWLQELAREASPFKLHCGNLQQHWRRAMP